MAKKPKKKSGPKRHPVQRLEQYLRIWEDVLGFLNYTIRAYQVFNQPIQGGLHIGGAIRHYRELRPFLLQCASIEVTSNFLHETNFSRFIQPPNAGSQYARCLGHLKSYPFEIAQWTRSSRRVFRLSGDLQALLEHTTLDGLTWKDVHWPLDSFAIELAHPIVTRQGNRYDTLLVSEHLKRFHGPAGCGCDYCSQRGECWSVRLLGNELDTYSLLTKEKKLRAERLLKKRQKNKALQFIDERGRYIHNRGPMTPLTGMDMNKARDMPVTMRWIQQVTDEELDAESSSVCYSKHLRRYVQHHEYMDLAYRIVVGLCQYLQMLPSGSSHRSDWKPVRRGSPNPNSITDTAEVCHVTSVHTLTPEERRVLDEHREGPHGYELCAHFRSGHWRRPPGKGDDPTAPKTVWVRPTLVRRDRLGPGELPGGAQSDAL